MNMLRLTITSAVLASAVASAGCSGGSSSFASLNTAYSSIKTTTKAAANIQLPAAAIATTLGGIQVIKALANAAHGGGIVAAGGGNAVGGTGTAGISGGQLPGSTPSFHIASTDSQTLPITDADTKVALSVKYSSSKDDSGKTTSSIDSCTGTAQGFNITAQGSFTYAPTSSGGDVSCQMTGNVTYKDVSMAIKKLTFACSDPLPTNADIGNVDFETSDAAGKSSLTAALKIDGNNKIVATGTYTGPDGKSSPLNFDQNSGGVVTSSADASASTGTN